MRGGRPGLSFRQPLNAVVVGAGVGGLAAAIELAQAGHAVTVIDATPAVGGLASGFSIGGTSTERYYHHLFRGDNVARDWIRAVGLGDRLEFLPASMGFYVDGHFHRFGTVRSLLAFTPLPLLDRVRLGLRVRRLAATASPAEFEDVTAMDWLSRRASPAELRVFWVPLLRAKFGDDLHTVSMVWLWARFRARVRTSHGGAERLGHLRGGFQQLSDALAEWAMALGVRVELGQKVTAVEIDRGVVTAVATVETRYPADAVVWTPSLRLLIAAAAGLPAEYVANCGRARYHDAFVVVAVYGQSVLPYYWVNVADASLPFTSAVEHTRLVGTEGYGGRTVVYLGRYADPNSEIGRSTGEELTDQFLAAAAQAFSPGMATPLETHFFRAPAAQPIIPVGWDTLRPPMRTGVQGLVAANIAQIYPWDRGINYSLELGQAAAAIVREDFDAGSER